jgi:hypothetical protein
MQVFIAELSNQIDQVEFEKSWHSEDSTSPFKKVDFAYTGRRISLTFEPGPEGRWQSDSVHRTFSSAVRRVDRTCNIRWI